MRIKYLIVVDMQKDFIDGALGTPEAQKILPAVISKVENFRGPVMFTRDTHSEDYLQTQEGKNLPVPHCIYGTDGWQLDPVLADYAQEHHSMIFDKPAFGSISLASCLSGIDRMGHIDEVELIGFCTDICVISNALLLKAAMPETVITVDVSCCAGATPQGHDTAVRAMKACQINITGEEEN